MSVIAAFPKRSLQLSRGTESGLLGRMVIGLVPVLWFSWLFVHEIRPLADEYRLHKTGVVARTSEVSNVDRTDDRHFHNVHFDLRYVTADGTSHNTRVAFYSSWDVDEMLLPLVVRYDPSSPGHISTSYGANYLTGRTIHVAFWSALPAGWICYLVLALLAQVRDGRRLRVKLAAIAAHPTPVQANITSVKDGKPSVEIFYLWKDSVGRTLNGSCRFKRDESPFWLDTAGTKLLALAGPNGESVLLDGGLAMVDLTGQERTRVTIARIESLNLSPVAAGELINKTIGSTVVQAPAPVPAPVPAPEAAAAAANEAAKKEIKRGYWYSFYGGRLADVAAASASGNRGIKVLFRFLLISGLASAVIAVGALAMHELKPQTQKVVNYEPFNLADGNAPRSRYVELTGLADPTLEISEPESGLSYIPLLPSHWRRGDPVVYFLYTKNDSLQRSQPVMIRQTGELISNALPSEIAAAFVQRGIKLGAPPILFESLKDFDDDHLDNYLAAVVIFGIYAGTVLFMVISVRLAARSMPNDQGRMS